MNCFIYVKTYADKDGITKEKVTYDNKSRARLDI